MRYTITEITVKDCTPKIITDVEKENNTKAPNMEKIQKSQVTQEPTQLCIWIYEVC